MAVLNEDSIDLPRSVAMPPGNSNGLPGSMRFENTGEVETAVAAAIDSEENTVEALAKLILVSQSGGSGGGDAGEKVLKDIKKHKWIAVLLTLVIGPGSMTATYYAIKERGISNERNIQSIKVEMIDDKIRQNANTKEIGLIKKDIGKIQESFKVVEKSSGEMLKGIKSLQQVNVTRLEKENTKLERQLARERERNR